MPLPETIAVKYTEEDAEFLSVRPVLRQTFQLTELLDMVLSVTGKDVPRIQKILRTGTVVFHFYRYRWEAIEAGTADLAAALHSFPDADPSRPFDPAHCTAVLLDTGAQFPPEWKREEASRKRFLCRRSFWDVLLALATEGSLRYANYSYDRKADVYALALDPRHRAELATAAIKLAPPTARAPLASLPKAQSLLYLCSR